MTLQNEIAIAALTGIFMIVLGIKLLWPPGMNGMSSLFTCCSCMKKTDSFLQDSKYGSAHVYIANTLLLLYVIHATFCMYPSTFYYWIFPLCGYLLSLLVHPGKGKTIGNLYYYFFHNGNFDRNYITLSKKSVPIKGSKLSQVTLTLQLPTFENQFREIYEKQPYTGFCDIALVKLKSRDSWFQNLETMHYYSAVQIKSTLRMNEIEVSLMIQRTNRKNGCSISLMDNAVDKNHIEVIGFSKSNSLESVYAPLIIAFGWESGAGAFCSLFRQRRIRKVQQNLYSHSNYVYSSMLSSTDGPKHLSVHSLHSLHNISSSIDPDECKGDSEPLIGYQDSFLTSERSVSSIRDLKYSKDLLVVWTNFGASASKMDVNKKLVRMTDDELCRSIVASVKELCSMQQYIYEQCGNAGIKVIFIVTNVPLQWTILHERIIHSPTKVDLSSSVLQAFKVGPFLNRNFSENTDQYESCSQNDLNRMKYPIQQPLKGSSFSSFSTDYSEVCTLASVKENFFAIPTSLSGVEFLLRLHNCEDCWIPFRNAPDEKLFKKTLKKRIMGSLMWQHSQHGPDITTFFVTEGKSSRAELQEFKYSKVYDEVNRAIIETQLQFQKNPEAFLSELLHNDGDPVECTPISCHVLYSGEFASPKLDQLKSVIDEIRMSQATSRTPASLTFMPES